MDATLLKNKEYCTQRSSSGSNSSAMSHLIRKNSSCLIFTGCISLLFLIFFISHLNLRREIISQRGFYMNLKRKLEAELHTCERQAENLNKDLIDMHLNYETCFKKFNNEQILKESCDTKWRALELELQTKKDGRIYLEQEKQRMEREIERIRDEKAEKNLLIKQLQGDLTYTKNELAQKSLECQKKEQTISIREHLVSENYN